MLCDECGQREATLHLMAVVNGKKTEKHLCMTCAEKSREVESAVGLKPDALLSAILQGGHAQNTAEKPDKTCRCGMTLSRFRKEGRLGCPDCYDTFREELLPMLQRIHGATVHNAGHVAGTAQKIGLEALKRELREAIDEENYEKAAVLRDKIREQEKEAAGNDGFMA